MKEIFKFVAPDSEKETLIHNKENFGNESEIIANEDNDNLENSIELKRKNLGDQVVNIFDNILKDKPKKLLEQVADLLKQGDLKGVTEAINECPDISEFQKILVDQFEKFGVIEKKDDFNIVDIDKIKNLDFATFYSNMPAVFTGYSSSKSAPETFNKNKKIGAYYGRGNKAETFFYSFNNLPVLSKDDYERGERQSKDLLYIPETAEDALNIKSIKKSDFYLMLSDFSRLPSDKKIMAKNQENIDKSAYLAAYIYHPQYGDGYRDEKDQKLYVKYNSGEYKPITTEFFKEVGQIKIDGESILNIKKVFQNDSLSELVKKDLIRIDDFITSRGSNSKPHELKELSKSGYVTIYDAENKPVRYYVGKGEELTDNNKVKALKLNNDLAVVLNEDENKQRFISHYFHLTDFNNPDLISTEYNKKNKKQLFTKTANKEISRTTKYDKKSMQQENEQTYSSLDNFDKLLNKIEQIKNKSGFDLLEKMNDESDWQKMSYALEKTSKNTDEISQFIKKYDSEQLANFATADVTVEEFDKYISLGTNLEEETAKQVLLKYNDLLSYCNKTANELKIIVDFGDKQPILNIEDIQSRAKKLLLDFADETAQAKLSGSEISYINILKKIDSIKQELVLFSSVFKTVSMDHDLELSEIKGVEVNCQNPDQLDEKEIKEMERIYQANKKHWPEELLNKALSEFQSDIKANKGRFYVLKINGEVTSFSWFNDIDKNRTYCGYFNVRPEARSSNIGKALKEVAYQKEGQFKILECYVYEEDKKLIDVYSRDYGFKVEKENVDPTGTGKNFYKLFRPTTRKLAA